MNMGAKEMNLKATFGESELEHHRKVRELLNRISLLQAQMSKDAAAYNLSGSQTRKQIDELHEIILEKDRKLSLIPTLQNEMDLLRNKYQNDMKENSNLIRKLQFQLEESTRYKPLPLDLETETLTKTLNRAKKQALGELEKPVKEVVYENNPYIIQQLDSLREENRRSQITEGDSKMKIVSQQEEISRLRGLIDKLREGVDTFKPNFGDEHRPDNQTITDYVMGVRANMIDRVLSFSNARKDKTIRELSFRVLTLNKWLEKAKQRYAFYESEKIRNIEKSDSQSLISIWGHFRDNFVEFLFDVYVRSKTDMHESKQNSFMIYRLNMENIFREHYQFLFIFMPIYHQ